MESELINKNIIVTGGSSGIGLETARALAGMGASVWIVGRSEAKTIQAQKSIIESTGNDNVDHFIIRSIQYSFRCGSGKYYKQ